MRLLVPYICLALTVGLICPAQAASPYYTTAALQGLQLRRAVHTPAKKGGRFAPIRISVSNVYGQGPIAITLNKRKLPSAQACFVSSSGECRNDPKVPVLYRGYVSLRRLHGAERKLPAAASVIDELVTVNFVGSKHGRTGLRQRVYTLRWKIGSEDRVSIRASAKPSALFLGRECSAHALKQEVKNHGSVTASAVAPTLESYRVVTISTDADPEWYARYGENSNVEIAATINAAEAIYERQMGIRFSIVRQHVYTTASPYVETNASKLLTSFARNLDNPSNLGISPSTFNDDVDLKHLFTGKELNGTTIGLSYVGAICWAPTSAYGLTQNVSRELNIRTFAHEAGHSLGASHDTSDPNGLMYPDLGLQSYFSQVSVDQIKKQLAVVGKCVSQELLGPNVANASITLTRRINKKRGTLTLRGVVLSAVSKPLVGESVVLRINSKSLLLTTDDEGKYTYSIRLRRIKARKLVVVAETNSGSPVASKKLKILVGK
jgi:hypothetical protein